MRAKKAKAIRQAVKNFGGHLPVENNYADINVREKKFNLTVLNAKGLPEIRTIKYKTSTKVLNNCQRALYQAMKVQLLPSVQYI